MDIQPRIVMVTAGAGGMYCGSCLQDNALAAALTRQGTDIQLVPTYTPIRTDEPNNSADQLFFGGINVYLQQKLPLWSKLPAALVRWLDNPQLIRFVTSRNMETDAASLGDLTVSMLRGSRGKQAIEGERLASWLAKHAQPNLVHFSNILISGCASTIKQRLNVPVIVTLQGDDLFLNGLQPKHHQLALEQIREIDQSIDGYLVHSQFYANHMSEYLGIDRDKFSQIPLAVSATDLHERSSPAKSRPPTVGYLARLAPEKGLHVLCEAMRLVRAKPETKSARLLVAGWLGAGQREYGERELANLKSNCGEDSVDYRGVISRDEKRTFLAEVDVLSVPTTYAEPKGLYVLEALATGTPFVQPDHGIFPELLESTGGGMLCGVNDPASLADALHQMLTDHEQRQQLGVTGQAGMLDRHTVEFAAEVVTQVYAQYI